MSTSRIPKPNVSNRAAIAFLNAGSLFDDFQAISNAIAERAFRLFQDGDHKDGHDLSDWFRAELELLKPVPIEVAEAAAGFMV